RPRLTMMVGLTFRDDEAALGDGPLKIPMRQRKRVLDAGSKHRDRGAARFQSCAMCRTVDPGRESAHDGRARPHERGRELACYALSVCRCPSCPDDCHARLYGENLERTAHPEMRWSIFMQVVEVGRVIRIVTFDSSGNRVFR